MLSSIRFSAFFLLPVIVIRSSQIMSEKKVPSWNVKHVLETLLFGGRHVLVGLQRIQSIKPANTIRKNRTYMGIEEERVHSPGERFTTHIEVLVVRRKRYVSIILSLEVLLMLSMLGFNLLHPEVTSPNCFVRVNIQLLTKSKYHLLAGKQT